MGTIVFMDGFDDYTNTQATEQGWSATFLDPMVTGRFGVGQAARIRQQTVTHTVPSATRYTVAFAWLTPNNTSCQPMIFREGATVHATCAYSSTTGTLSFSGTTFGGSSTSVNSNTWYHIEIDLTVGDSPNGAYSFKVNQQVVGSGSSIDTKNGGTGIINTLAIFATTGAYAHIDDLVAMSGGGILGDCRIITQYPNGNGATGFEGSDGNQTDNYLLVDESPGHTSDTDYVHGAVPGTRETYSFPALGVTGSVKAVSIVEIARKDGSADRRTTSVVQRGQAYFDGWEELALGASYMPGFHLYENDPLTGAAWSISDIDASDFGVCLLRRSFVLSAVVGS